MNKNKIFFKIFYLSLFISDKSKFKDEAILLIHMNQQFTITHVLYIRLRQNFKHKQADFKTSFPLTPFPLFTRGFSGRKQACNPTQEI